MGMIHKAELDVYLYGMTLLSTVHRLDGEYPAADTYGEINETYTLPGGETANAAIVLANLGYNVKSDGPYLGFKTKEMILKFGEKYRIDCSGMHYDPGFEGVSDLVLVAKGSRTVFGRFGQYFANGHSWTAPDKTAIQAARIISLDPFFQEESRVAAEACIAANKKYVTIDCAYDSFIHQNAAATVISNEFIQNTYPTENPHSLFQKYTNATEGLVIFTFGARDILYGRKGEGIKNVPPYRVKAISTLGAGDTFRAGIIHGLLNEWDDLTTVKFAAATAALVCTRFPMAVNPPDLEGILELMRS
ncbi:MAG TPA: PfkB family carbohydrate kinase [Bacillota bacterium]|nr:PfkB family carbohydrate kinase [Bacillota bacterium]